MDETNEQLLARQKHVKELATKMGKQIKNMKSSTRRNQKSMFVGMLNFTLLQIKSKIEERCLQ